MTAKPLLLSPCLARRRATLAALVAAGIALASPAAQAVGRLLDVTVIDRDTGQVLPVHRHDGRLWIAGRPGARYAIALRNRLGERLLGVVSVDGVNAVSGETAAWSQTGYVLSARQRYEITGWRKSDDQVAAFEFTSLGDAYATRTGRASNVGVIGVAVFRERREPPAIAARELPSSSWPQAASGSGADARGDGGTADRSAKASASAQGPAPAARAAEAGSAPRGTQADSAGAAAESGLAARARRDEKLGTGHGGREWSSVRRTAFERALETPDEVVALHYDSRDNLVALGVLPAPRPVLPPAPDPFPRSASSSYVPDPPAR